MWDLNAAEDQPPTLDEGVAVVAEAAGDEPHAYPIATLLPGSGDSSSSAMRRSVGVVTLMFSASDVTTRTTPPARSISHASSVAMASSSSEALARARSSAERRNTCGV